MIICKVRCDSLDDYIGYDLTSIWMIKCKARFDLMHLKIYEMPWQYVKYVLICKSR